LRMRERMAKMANQVRGYPIDERVACLGPSSPRETPNGRRKNLPRNSPATH
jgi:hypothetical protein